MYFVVWNFVQDTSKGFSKTHNKLRNHFDDIVFGKVTQRVVRYCTHYPDTLSEYADVVSFKGME